MAKREAKGASLKILIVRFSAIGDCVMAGYAVNDLRHAYPDAEITWVVEDRCAEVVAEPKLVNRKLALPRSIWRKKGEIRTLLEQYRWLTGLRKYHFDYGFDLQGHSKTAWCLRLSGAKKRMSIGATDALAQRLNPVYVDPELEMLHAVERSRRMIGSVLPVKPVSSDFIPGDSVPQESNLVTICVGAGHPAKVVPPETLAFVGGELTERGYEVVYLGGAKDSFDAPDRTRNLVGETTLAESIQWIRRSKVHIAGDTGTGHIAAAVGTPLVTIWGNMPLYRFRPNTKLVTILDEGGIPSAVPGWKIENAAVAWLEWNR